MSKTIFSFVATRERPNLSGLTEAPMFDLSPLLMNMTVRVLVRVEADGWRGSIVEWGDDTLHSFRLYARRAGEVPEEAEWDDVRQNYLSFPDESGACDVMEAEVSLRSHNPKWTRMRVGVPAARIGKGRLHDVILRFSGSRLSLFVDGVLVDEEWPVGSVPSAVSPLRIGGEGFKGVVELVEVWPIALSDADIIKRCGGQKCIARREVEILGPERTQAQYWTPRGHNQWVGDVMLGDAPLPGGKRFHVFYLADRRHHASKFKAGGHTIAHMSSGDLLHWKQHPQAFEAEPWETVGTGRPLVHNGKVFFFYGMHTSRIIPENSLVGPAINSDGRTLPQQFPNGERYPQGTSFAESDDGDVFSKSRLLVHPAQNPNVCADEKGKGFLMLAGYGSRGLWHSTDLRHWRLIDEDIIPVGADSPARNSDECQCMFEWNGWHYIIAGRTGYWMSRQRRGPYWAGKEGTQEGVVKPRWDIYDGVWVPMVAPFKSNRRLLAGFLQGPQFEWGGHLVFRELVQCEDGTLGTKWPKEMMPPVRSSGAPVIKTKKCAVPGNSVSVTATAASWAFIDGVPSSALLTARVSPAAGTSYVGVAVLDEEQNGCALSVLPRQGRVQWNTMEGVAVPPPVPTLEEVLAQDSGAIWEMQNPHLPFKGGDFVITNVEGIDEPFQIEILFVYDPKSRSTIIDACVNGQRTLITRRKGLVATQLRLLADGKCDFSDITLGELG